MNIYTMLYAAAAPYLCSAATNFFDVMATQLHGDLNYGNSESKGQKS